ncbi:polyphosphate polymerase domain-containing protein [Radiobacillus deserti]|uniref:Polyphosphate polymerase domain-containing protein n=1 Tax=Radiobacillus deserti TaxID=2594883 RepID=A0A516KKI6_9BACI|nr:polyphosphate polymerase domain-containing protein [Radiobacillus deserti]QDP41907.1 polyphosphate polymerase domain-containing protein [Radiobacillus deserti]
MSLINQNGSKGRRELKHELTKMDCHLLRNKLKHVMRLDPHADADGKYFIRSVYFDNFDNKVLTQKKEGFFERDKYRIRLYNYNSDIIHLEKKSKRDNLTYKEKCPVTAQEYESIRYGAIDWMKDDARKLIQELYVHMKLYKLTPLTVVDYEREVYIYEHGNVRVTFDSEIKTSFRNNDLLNPDLPMVETDSDIVILEVKFDEYFPDVIRRLLQLDNRRRGTYSKYQVSRMYG